MYTLLGIFDIEIKSVIHTLLSTYLLKIIVSKNEKEKKRGKENVERDTDKSFTKFQL